MKNFLNSVLTQYSQNGSDLLNEYLAQFARLLGLQESWFQGTNLILYIILPVASGIYVCHLMLNKLRIFRDETVNYLLAFSMGFFTIFIGKVLLYATIPLIIWMRFNIYHGFRTIFLFANFVFKVILIGLVFWGLSLLG